MGDSMLAVLAGQAQQTLAAQRSQVDTAKLLVTFSTAVAATVVASALQTAPTTVLDVVSTWFLLGAFILAIVAILLDRTTTIGMPTDVRMALAATGEQLERDLQIQTLEAVEENRGKVNRITTVSFVQFVVSGASGILGAVSLLQA